MIPCKKIDRYEARYLEKFKHEGTPYKTLTYEKIFVFKSTNGFWYYYCPEKDGFVSNGFHQKSLAIEHIEKFEQPRLSWLGSDKIHYARQAKQKKENSLVTTLSVTGHTVEYWENFINKFVDQLLSFAKDNYGVEFDLDRTISFIESYKCRKSVAYWGRFGKPQKIVLRFAPYMEKTDGQFKFNEYKHIQDDPIIGSFRSSNFEDIVKALVCHEVAHSIQQNINFFTFPIVKNYLDTTSKRAGNHGKEWQTIYYELKTKN